MPDARLLEALASMLDDKLDSFGSCFDRIHESVAALHEKIRMLGGQSQKFTLQVDHDLSAVRARLDAFDVQVDRGLVAVRARLDAHDLHHARDLNAVRARLDACDLLLRDARHDRDLASPRAPAPLAEAPTADPTVFQPIDAKRYGSPPSRAMSSSPR